MTQSSACALDSEKDRASPLGTGRNARNGRTFGYGSKGLTLMKNGVLSMFCVKRTPWKSRNMESDDVSG